MLEAIVVVVFSQAGSKSKGQKILKKFPQLAKRKGAIKFASSLWTGPLAWFLLMGSLGLQTLSFDES